MLRDGHVGLRWSFVPSMALTLRATFGCAKYVPVFLSQAHDLAATYKSNLYICRHPREGEDPAFKLRARAGYPPARV